MTWLVEEGIGEHRAILVERDILRAARIAWPGELAAGTVEDAVLVSRTAGSPRGTARFPGGQEALVDHLPASASEGAPIRLEVTRPALAERGRLKRAQARPSEWPPRPAPTLAESLRAAGEAVRMVRRFDNRAWDELVAEAFAGEVPFAGGTLQFSPTPAMLLVDVDGTGNPRELALRSVRTLADAVLRFDLGGSIGVDFPSIAARDDRRALDEALGEALAGWPHERTAMNGFGFVQLVARLERISLLHRATFQPAAMAARWLLRRAEGLSGPGAIELSGDPAVELQLRPEWLTELARRTGREVRWRAEASLALEAPHAQVVPR
jgi:ribonuclease G